jgi:MFS family permease
LFERAALLPGLMAFFSLCGFGAVQTFVAVYTEHLGVAGVELYFFVLAGVMLFSRPLFGKLTDRRGFTIPVIIGLSFVVAGFILLSQITSTVLLIVCAVLFGVGFGAVNPTLQTMAVANASPQRRGVATATFFVGFDGGIGIGSVLAGTIAGLVGYSNMYLFAIVLPIITGTLYLTLGRRQRSKPFIKP